MKVLHTRSCYSCPKQKFCFLGELTAHQIENNPLLRIQTLSAPKGTRIYSQEDTREYNFIVSQGLVKNTKMHDSGKEQVFFISYPGDLIGVDSLFNEKHSGSAEAIIDSYVCKIKRSALMQLAKEDLNFTKGSLAKSADYITDFSERICILNCPAISRVAWALLNHLKRFSACENKLNKLPMLPRADIASYLFLTVETLSRKLTELRNLNLIDFDRQTIIIHSIDGLQNIIDDSIGN